MNNNSTFAYVHTESGPIKPAKAVPIEMMKNIVASIQGKHVRGEKGTNWADLAKKVNKDCNPHGYTTIQTILNKALTEAAAQAVGQSLFRLDLGNVVCDSAHAKFKINRRNHSVIRTTMETSRLGTTWTTLPRRCLNFRLIRSITSTGLAVLSSSAAMRQSRKPKR